MGRGPERKINQLEKVKLMEVLDLDDATAVKFFGLKDEHQKTMMDLRDRSDEILDDIEETLSGDESKNRSSLNKLLQEFDANEEQMFRQRRDFLKEAENVLTPPKFARFIVFERKFRAEIRDLIMSDRMRRRGRP